MTATVRFFLWIDF